MCQTVGKIVVTGTAVHILYFTYGKFLSFELEQKFIVIQLKNMFFELTFTYVILNDQIL